MNWSWPEEIEVYFTYCLVCRRCCYSPLRLLAWYDVHHTHACCGIPQGLWWSLGLAGASDYRCCGLLPSISQRCGNDHTVQLACNYKQLFYKCGKWWLLHVPVDLLGVIFISLELASTSFVLSFSFWSASRKCWVALGPRYSTGGSDRASWCFLVCFCLILSWGLLFFVLKPQSLHR